MVDCVVDHDELVDCEREEIIDDLSFSIFVDKVRENKKMIYFDMKSHI